MDRNVAKTDIGLVGLGVMGRGLAVNLARRGWKVSVYNRLSPGKSPDTVVHFVSGAAAGLGVQGYTDGRAFVVSIARPRKVLMMVPAGEAVDQVMEWLLPLLSAGDVLVDGGNSHYESTLRRQQQARQAGVLFVGAGISGGEEGALKGASIMPGGSPEAWPLLRPLLQSIAARATDDMPCCQWIGPEGSGHFVKMVHNGIEYAAMQLMAETYWIMKQQLGMDNEQMADCFGQWNAGRLQGYLTEITACILRHKEPAGGYLLDKVSDVAGQNATGRWTVEAALKLGMAPAVIAAAVCARNLSADRRLRSVVAGSAGHGRSFPAADRRDEWLGRLEEALYASLVVAYAEGFELLQRASTAYGWQLDLSLIAHLWCGGCIIRTAFLDDVATAFDTAGVGEGGVHLLHTACFGDLLAASLDGWKQVVTGALEQELPVPAFAAALSYYYSLASRSLPTNLIQAQRDCFGAHTFERTDARPGISFHEAWMCDAGSSSLQEGGR